MGWITLFAAAAIGAAGCATRAGKGAAVGGVSGTVLGAGIGAGVGGNKGAVIGAGVGAAAGAGAGAIIGHYMDKQAAAMKKDVKSAQVVRQGDKLLVKFNSQILFDTNKATLKDDARHDLAEFANVLKQYPDTNLMIEGHTDSTGPRDFNEELSWKRAKAVIAFLEDEGVQPGRLSAQGYADTRPVATNSTDEGRRQNRRVQIEISANERLREQAAAEERQQSSRQRRAALGNARQSAR